MNYGFQDRVVKRVSKIFVYEQLSKSRKSEFSMKLNLSYKNIHIGSIAIFYLIALLVRLISLHFVGISPKHQGKDE